MNLVFLLDLLFVFFLFFVLIFFLIFFWFFFDFFDFFWFFWFFLIFSKFLFNLSSFFLSLFSLSFSPKQKLKHGEPEESEAINNHIIIIIYFNEYEKGKYHIVGFEASPDRFFLFFFIFFILFYFILFYFILFILFYYLIYLIYFMEKLPIIKILFLSPLLSPLSLSAPQ